MKFKTGDEVQQRIAVGSSLPCYALLQNKFLGGVLQLRTVSICHMASDGIVRVLKKIFIGENLLWWPSQIL